jgi:acyl carrier protein
MPSSASHDDAARTFDGVRVERSVLEWLRAEFDDPDITGADNFLDIGGHSLAFAKLNKHLEDSLGVNLVIKVVYEESLATAAAEAQPVRASV